MGECAGLESSRTMISSLLFPVARLLVDLLSVRDWDQQSSKLKLWPCGISCGCFNGRYAERGGVQAIGWSLATIIERLPKRRWSALLPSPETILRWHRQLVRRKSAPVGGVLFARSSIRPSGSGARFGQARGVPKRSAETTWLNGLRFFLPRIFRLG